jgi:hypothetical protein
MMGRPNNYGLDLVQVWKGRNLQQHLGVKSEATVEGFIVLDVSLEGLGVMPQPRLWKGRLVSRRSPGGIALRAHSDNLPHKAAKRRRFWRHANYNGSTQRTQVPNNPKNVVKIVFLTIFTHLT